MAALSYDWNIEQPSVKNREVKIDLGLYVSLLEGNMFFQTGSVVLDSLFQFG